MYDNERDAKRYLQDSVIRVGKKPIYVSSIFTVRGKQTVKYFPLGSYQTKIIALDDEDLNFNPVPLGYGKSCRGYPSVGYFHRYPARMWKQGLSWDSLKILTNEEGYFFYNIREDIESSKILLDVIKGKKVSYDRAFKGENCGIFSRKWAVHPISKSVLYKGKLVGKAEKNKILLLPEYGYLDKVAEEASHVGSGIL